MDERMLAHIFAHQRAFYDAEWDGPTTEELRRASLCEIVGYSEVSQCPLSIAERLLLTALHLAANFDGKAEDAPIDAIEVLVRRAQDLAYSILPDVPGRSECFQFQNWGRGVSMAFPGIFSTLASLQVVLEAWLLLQDEAVRDGEDHFCPVSKAQHQGEWFFEADFLRDFAVAMVAEGLGTPQLGDAGATRPRTPQ